MTISVLNPEQSAAVAHDAGPLRILAGAGTGKTHTLTERVVGLVRDQRATPREILVLTFTNKAVDELHARIDPAIRPISPQGQRVDIDTYHAFGGRIVSSHGYRLGVPDSTEVMTDAEAWILLWRALDQIDFQHLDLTFLRGGYGRSPLSSILKLNDRLADELRTLHDLATWLETAPDTSGNADLWDYFRALSVYERRKRELGTIDYSDQIMVASRLLEIPEVAAEYHDRYRYVLVDEFQDTNYAQSVLVRLLAGRQDANVCVVGDPNQAIYGFRGAAPDTLDRFLNDFPGALTQPLTANYRSTQSILDTANAVWDSDPGEFRGNLLAASGNSGVRPQLVSAATLHDEVAYIAGQIEQQVESGRSWNEIAVIVRKNAIKTDFWKGLREAGIPAEIVGGTSLYETPEIREILSYLRAISDQKNDAAFAHILSSERWGLDELTLYELTHLRKRSQPLQLVVRTAVREKSAPAGVERCLRSLDRLVQRSYAGILPLLDDIIAVRKGGYDQVEAANVEAFYEKVRQLAENRIERPTLEDLVAYLDLLIEAGGGDDAAEEIELRDSDTVKVLTAHAAKGLEWPIVFVASANKNDFVNSFKKTDLKLPPSLIRHSPGAPARDDYDQDEEERFTNDYLAWAKRQQQAEELRVLYVALTRAQERLFITWSEAHPKRSGLTKILPTLEPVKEWCDLIEAPRAETISGPMSMADFARTTLPAITGTLRRIEDDDRYRAELEQSLIAPWVDAGGDPAAVSRAVDEFISRRSNLLENMDVIASIEQHMAKLPPRTSDPGRPLSYTQMATFFHCPHQYYLRYVLGLPGKPKSWATAAGTAFHEIVALEADRRNRGESSSLEDLRAWYRSDLDVANLETDTIASPDPGLVDPIAAYLASPDLTATPILVEEPFVLPLGRLRLNGIIDRLQQRPDGIVEVVDYKTDRHLPDAAKVRDNLQLPIYLLAARDLVPDGVPAPSQAVMFYVRHDERITVTFSDDELEAIRQKLIDIANAMLEVSPTAHHASIETCRWCAWIDSCRFAVRQ